MSAASRDTSVPVMPIAMPMSAALSAGASLTPSPVIATTSPEACNARTIASLCSGATRANTRVRPIASSRAGSPSAASAAPVIAADPAGAMPSSAAIAAAAAGWSPVIISTLSPAFCAAATASRASGRGGSIMPTTPSQTSASSWSNASLAPSPGARRR